MILTISQCEQVMVYPSTDNEWSKKVVLHSCAALILSKVFTMWVTATINLKIRMSTSLFQFLFEFFSLNFLVPT